MRLTHTLLGILLTVQAGYGLASSSTTTDIERQKLNTTILMASHLPKTLYQQLGLPDDLVQVRQHSLYDTPVTLTDARGERIRFREQLVKGKSYTGVSIGETSITPYSIWFFSNDGRDQSDADDGADICTAEQPCSILNQNIAGMIHERTRPNEKVSLRFASGEYNLASQDRQKAKGHIELYASQNIIGRSRDFRHAANQDDRPLLHGKLEWIGYTGHQFSSNLVHSIRMLTGSENPTAQDQDVYNLLSKGTLGVFNSELQIVLEERPTSDSINISSRTVFVYDSDISNVGTERQQNIEAESVHAYDSRLSAQGLIPINLVATGDELNILGSTIIQSCLVCANPAIYTYDVPVILVDSSIIKVNTLRRDESIPGYDHAAGLYVASQKVQSTVTLRDTNIDVSSKNGQAFVALSTGNLAHWIIEQGCALKSQSLYGEAFGLKTQGTILFSNQGSSLSIGGNNPDDFFPERGQLNLKNNSSPLSQCVLGDSTSQDCQ